MTEFAQHIFALGHPTAPSAGGKADHLARLIQRGVAVPKGVVLSPAVFAALVTSKVSDPLAARVHIAALEFPDALVQSLLDQVRRLGPSLIVRSSALGEDAVTSSFAGQLDSVRCGASAADVVRALRTCWMSYYGERSLNYQAHRGHCLRGLGVVVQEYVEADFSGILFTRSPNEGEHLLVEYAEGGCEKLVDGSCTPGVLSFRRHDLKLVGAVTQGMAELPSACLQPLLETALAIEQQMHAAVDMEWAYTQDKGLVILQARPITVPADSRAAAAQGVLAWSNDNMAENYPEPVCPLLYSVAQRAYYHYFKNLARAFGLAHDRIIGMEGALRHLVGAHGGGLYYNLTSVYRCLLNVPWGERVVRHWNTFLSVTDAHGQGVASAQASKNARPPGWVESVRMAGASFWHLLTLPRRVRRFEARVERLYEQTGTAAEAAAWQEVLLEFWQIRCRHWLDASLADAAAMFGIGILTGVITRMCGKAEASRFLPALLGDVANLESKKPILALAELEALVRKSAALTKLVQGSSPSDLWTKLPNLPEHGDFLVRLRGFIKSWGFRRAGELMLTKPTYIDEPWEVLALLQSRLATSRIESESDGKARRLEAEAELREHGPYHQYLAVRASLWLTQHGVRLRERTRVRQAQHYYCLRRAALAVGDLLQTQGVLNARDDAFFLTFDELEGLLGGSSHLVSSFAAVAAARRQALARERLRPCPARITSTHAQWLRGAAGSEDGGGGRDEAEGARLSGMGASHGTTTGAASVIRSLDDIHGFVPDSILVTKHTDPGWTALFAQIRGLVLERGGLLCHGAIVAREFGLPTVTGVTGATSAIKDGDVLKVNGTRGTVDFL